MIKNFNQFNESSDTKPDLDTWFSQLSIEDKEKITGIKKTVNSEAWLHEVENEFYAMSKEDREKSYDKLNEDHDLDHTYKYGAAKSDLNPEGWQYATKVEFMEKVLVALGKYREAYFELGELWASDHSFDIDLNDYLSSWYPQGWASHDEMDLVQWVDESSDDIRKAIEGMKNNTEGND